MNVFSIESFVDRLARESGTEPGRLPAVDHRQAGSCESGSRSGGRKGRLGHAAGEGSGRGVSLGLVFGSYLSTVAEVAVDKQGGVQVKRLTSPSTAGPRSTPTMSCAQIQGGVIFGLTAALWGDITVAEGRIQQSNFHDYRMLRIDEMPQIEVHLVRNEESAGRNRRGRDRPRAACHRQCSVGSDRPGDRQAADRAYAPGAGGSGMSWFWRHRLVSLIAAAIIVVAAFWVGRMLFQPGPLAFAGGTSSPWQDYRVPNASRRTRRSLPADGLTRGKYLTHAGRLRRPATPPGRQTLCRWPAVQAALRHDLDAEYHARHRKPGSGRGPTRSSSRAMHEGMVRRRIEALSGIALCVLHLADRRRCAGDPRLSGFARAGTPGNRPNTFAFPFNQRWLMAIWSGVFNQQRAASSRSPIAARNGTAAPIWRKPRRIAASAIPRAT